MGDAIYTESQPQADEVRLNKYIAHAGVASRRGADELIKEGRVKVNGEVVTEMGYKVKLKDDVEFDGKSLSLERKYYLLLNKPKDFITTVSDERDRKTVMDLVRSAYTQMKTIKRPRLYPVGRLDRNTTGVLLITNDGELAQKLTHPSSEVRKVYHVMLDKKLMKEDFDKIAEGGVVLEDGIAEVDIIAYPNPKNKAEIGLEIHTGKNRFVRRIFESLGYEIEKLDRVSFAGLTKKDLPRGRWRFLQEEEVRLLKHFQK
ncbi:MAG: rRNA pseudouridine synthase [Bacteroidetes bacterium]|nr:rRNA pseudouridine synthase [Bacteroidota bacterium]MBK8657937.1 rRNA pseudouridine synthase [Bacteroidota bacterium]